jgi:hypothetical protein
MSVKESGSGLGGFDAFIVYCQQIGHGFWLHGDLLNDLGVGDPVAEGINDLNVLDVGNSVSYNT